MKRAETGAARRLGRMGLMTLVTVSLLGCEPAQVSDAESPGEPAAAPRAGLVDDERIKRAAVEEPGSWLAYGQTFEEQRFSTLTQINRETVADLGLAWFKPLGERHRMENTPLIVDGVMYVSDPWNVTYALDATTGEEIWAFDPETRREIVRYSCCGGPMTRGVAVYQGRVFIATFDGRVVAVDAATGEKVWDVDTYHPSAVSPFTVTGAPRAGGGKVYIGQSSSEYGVRGYVSAYDADTGELAWRFYLVPGDPSQPFEHPELEMAAETWNGEWWKLGGGGTVWSSIVYDPDLHTVYLGVGNGAPWPRDIRSPGGGDNLFLTAIVAVDPDTGRMKWYYQTVPGDNWDYSSAMDMVLADMDVDGTMRKVLLQAPKNGFFYVLDREDGELLRAHPYGAITWATHVDMETGRPVENPEVYYEENASVDSARRGRYAQLASHVVRREPRDHVHPHPRHGVLLRPGRRVREDRHIQDESSGPDYRPGNWCLPRSVDCRGRAAAGAQGLPEGVRSAVRRDAVGCRERRSLATAAFWPLRAASSSRAMARAPFPLTTPTTARPSGSSKPLAAHSVPGRLATRSTAPSILRSPARCSSDYDGGGRILVFKLGGDVELPPAPGLRDTTIPEQPPLTASADDLARGDQLYHQVCANCHGTLGRDRDGRLGGEAVGGLKRGVADLRRMSPETHASYLTIVLGGMLQDLGMRSFADVMDEDDVEAIRQFVISRANLAQEAQ